MNTEHRYYRVTPSPDWLTRTLTAEYFRPGRGWREVRNSNTVGFLHALEHSVVPPGLSMELADLLERCPLRRSPCGAYYLRRLT